MASNKFYITAGLPTKRDGTYPTGANKAYITAGLVPEMESGDLTLEVLNGSYIITGEEASFTLPLNLISPTDNATGVSIPVAFSWVAVTGASSYQIQVATEDTFASPVHDDATLTTNSDSVSLSAEVEYFWRVRSAS